MSSKHCPLGSTSQPPPLHSCVELLVIVPHVLMGREKVGENQDERRSILVGHPGDKGGTG